MDAIGLCELKETGGGKNHLSCRQRLKNQSQKYCDPAPLL